MGFEALFVGLILTHLLADFYWQPMSWVNDRNTHHFKAKKLYFHVSIHAVSSLAVLILWEYTFGWQDHWRVIFATLIIAITHYFIDLVKSYSSKGVIPFLLDQIAHVFVLLAVAIELSDSQQLYQDWWQQLSNLHSVIIICAYLIVLKPSSVFISLSLKRISKDFTSDDSLPTAGHSIGLLERVLMLTFILLDEFTGVGFLLAAKSIFRFGDLSQSKDKQLTEYVMLGTLLSLSVTVFIAIIVKYLLQ